MEFNNSFTVRAPLDTVWSLLLDANEVAPCVPGAQITEALSETHFRGTVKVKLGAVQVTYRGELQVEPDESSRTIKLHAKGTEMRGSGGASGTATTTVFEREGGVTEVNIRSQVDVTGRVAQFGRGIMQDVATRLINEFARCLEQKLQAEANATLEQVEADPRKESAPPEAAPSEGRPQGPGASQEQAISETFAPPAPPAPAATTQQPHPADLELLPLLTSVVRARVAAGLRRLAALVEPK